MSTALVYVGQLRTWRKAIPTWYSFFDKFKPDLYLFVNEQENKPSIEEFSSVFGKSVKIKKIHFWDKEDLDQWNKLNTIILEKTFIKEQLVHHPKLPGFSFQFYQLQKAFDMIDLSNYDQVVKFRFDIVLRNNRKFNLEAPWDKPELVIPHISQMWQETSFDYFLNGQPASYFKYLEGITLGADIIINKHSEYKIINKDKVVWMMGDCVYWSTGKNMQILHKNIFDKYGEYNIKECYRPWSPEAQLFYHARSLSLQPLISITVEPLRE